MNIADRKLGSAPAAAQSWLASFEAALQSQDAAAAAALFLADGLWRDVLAFTWTLQTMAGQPSIEATLRQTAARTQPKNFHCPAGRTAPRWVSRAGTETIEAIFEFETAFGAANGVVRLVPDPEAPARLRAGPSSPPCRNSEGTKRPSRSVRPRRTTACAISAATTGSTV